MSCGVGEGISTLAAQRGEVFVTDDAQNDPRISERLRRINVDEAIRAMICVPIKLGPNVFGVFNLQYSDSRTFAAEDLRLMQTLAHRAAMALHNARLFEGERTTRERLDVALAAGSMGTWEWEAQAGTVSWTPQLEAIHGLAPGTFAGTFEAYLADIHPDDTERVQRMIAESLSGKEHNLEYRIIWPDGSLHWLGASGATIRDRDGTIIGLRGVCHDITARKMEEAERARLRERERVASEARAALEERQRLARELHDSVSQALYGIGLGSQTVLAALHEERNLDAAEDAAAYVHKLAEASIAEMRALIVELRPESLEQDGLAAALERQIASVQAGRALDVQVNLEAEPSISLDQKQALYRIAQEGIHNVLKHAHATSIQLSLREEDGHVQLEIADDGVGFDPAAGYPGHLGLTSMRERAAVAGAQLTIQSTPGQGSRLSVDLPTASQGVVGRDRG
jgi:PAS domain S-box-containing protein